VNSRGGRNNEKIPRCFDQLCHLVVVCNFKVYPDDSPPLSYVATDADVCARRWFIWHQPVFKKQLRQIHAGFEGFCLTQFMMA